MDLLEQYKKENPQPFREQKPAPMTDEYGREYSGLVALVIRLSVGKIRDTRQASYVLLAVAGVIALTAAILFIRLLGIGTGLNTSKVVPIAGPSNALPR